jgi:methyltransferase (TIGR00027 family)
MKQGQPSSTAIHSAMMRAAHLLWDADAKIFCDDLALQLAGFENEATLRRALDTRHQGVANQFGVAFLEFYRACMRGIMTVRSRYTEEELDKAVDRGVAQYVILGAGIDSFAYRRRDLANALRVFEVDHPSSQEWKRSRLRDLKIALPPNLSFVPVDFERQTLIDALHTTDYRFEDAGFFSWLGVTQYLSCEATLATLRQVASLAAGTEIVFEFTVPGATLDGEERRYFEAGKAAVAARGEPWLGFFEPGDLLARLQEIGFGQLTHVSPDQLNARYFAGRTDGLRTPQAHHLMKAVVQRGKRRTQ